MKTSPAKLRVAFLDPGNAPDDDAFETMLGAAFARSARSSHVCAIRCRYLECVTLFPKIRLVSRRLSQTATVPLPDSEAQRFSSFADYRTARHNFAVNRAHACAIARLSKTATCYPEGTGILLDRTTCDVELVVALVSAKLAH